MDPANPPRTPCTARTTNVHGDGRGQEAAAGDMRGGRRQGRSSMPLLAVLLLCAMPHSAHAQVFIASHPRRTLPSDPCSCRRPVGKENTGGVPAPLTVTGVVEPRAASTASRHRHRPGPLPLVAAEVAGTAGAAGPDPALVRQVNRWLQVKEHGSLRPLCTRSNRDGNHRGRSPVGRGAVRDVWPMRVGLPRGTPAPPLFASPGYRSRRAWTGSSGSTLPVEAASPRGA